jgi:hypothetical protein
MEFPAVPIHIFRPCFTGLGAVRYRIRGRLAGKGRSLGWVGVRVAVRSRGSGHCLSEDPGEGWFEEAVGTAAEHQPERNKAPLQKPSDSVARH